MKYVITGGAGNISKPIVEALLKTGHQVTVIGRTAAHLEGLVALGATAKTGSVDDRDFVIEAFAGAEAVYTMVPPNFAPTAWVDYITGVGQNYADAIRQHGIRYVVNLSSVGGHMQEGAGPVSGLARVETLLNKIEGLNVKHLRPGYFYLNFLGLVGLVKHANILGANFGGTSKALLVHPKDIAEAAIEELTTLNFTGSSVRHVVGDEKNGSEIAAALGAAIGEPQLPWVEFTDEQQFDGGVQAGLNEEVSRNYAEMGKALRSGEMTRTFYEEPVPLSPTKIEDFAPEFAAAYQSA
jgi:uncharacterized protein YbjT (DUF2867 family)